MKLQQAIDRVDEIRPNMQSRELKIAAMSELDGMIWRELIMTHAVTIAEYERYKGADSIPQMPQYDADTDPGTELLVLPPYDNLYVYWLMAKIDEQTMEQEKFNNDRAMYTAAWETFSDYWTRTHMPTQRTRELRI